MMRTRLRAAYPNTGEFYGSRYPNGYRHDRWPDHVERVAATVDFIAPLLTRYPITSVADLSCGDGAVVRGLLGVPAHKIRRTTLGDVHSVHVPWVYDVGPSALVDHTLLPGRALPESLGDLDLPVDLYVCSETLEHMNDPDTLLYLLRDKAKYLFVSTPEGEEDDSNPEHYWGWDSGAISYMLHEAGWTTIEHKIFVPESADTYRFQFWLCR